MTHKNVSPNSRFPRFNPDDPPELVARKLNQCFAAIADALVAMREPATVGWSTTNVVQDRDLSDPASVTTTELGHVLGTLIDDLKHGGVIAP